MTFLLNNYFSTRALLSEHLKQAIVAAYKPWASTSLKGVLGGLKSVQLFLLIGRWAYNWVGVRSGVGGLLAAAYDMAK